MRDGDAPGETLDRRRAGILLHITSLPGSGACGDLGAEAYNFVDFLADAGLIVWQTLPVGPTQDAGSPYQTSSIHAGNTFLIGLSQLVDSGYLDAKVLHQEQLTYEEKQAHLVTAWRMFEQYADDSQWEQYNEFKKINNFWLEDYLLFQAIKDDQENKCWWDWPTELRDRLPWALDRASTQFIDKLAFMRFEQFLFYQQWCSLKKYANERGVKLFGDMPIFVAPDSAEVWAHRDIFCLNSEGQPEVVAGVPPDYFSATGQRWGNPLYDWQKIEQDNFSFWTDRLKTQLYLFDLIRIDHFRGFESYWEIPANEELAINGRWVKAPGEALFDHLHEIYDPLPLVAEDLGLITPEVDALRMKYRLPGMKILQFAFSGEPENPYLPFRHEANTVVYTGTHDNDTTLGWYNGLDDGLRQYVDEYLGYSAEEMPWPLIRSALASRARFAILPMQDILALETEHRMNLPGTIEGNWKWRFTWDQLDGDTSQRLRHMISMYGRL